MTSLVTITPKVSQTGSPSPKVETYNSLCCHPRISKHSPRLIHHIADNPPIAPLPQLPLHPLLLRHLPHFTLHTLHHPIQSPDMRLNKSQMLLKQRRPLCMLRALRKRFRSSHRDREFFWSRWIGVYGGFLLARQQFLCFLDGVRGAWYPGDFGDFRGFFGGELGFAPTFLAFAFPHCECGRRYKGGSRIGGVSGKLFWRELFCARLGFNAGKAVR